MLLSFRATNHKSLRDEQHLLLTPADQEADELPPPSKVRPLPVVGIFGPNASGKSNVLDAMLHMRRLVSGRFTSGRLVELEDGIPRRPFQLDNHSANLPTTYVVDVLLDYERYTYGFAIGDETVHDEWLYRYTHNGVEEIIFERDSDGIRFNPKSDHPDPGAALEPTADFLFLSLFSTLKSGALNPRDNRSVGKILKWFKASFSVRISPDVPSRVHRAMYLSRVASGEQIERLSRLLAAADTGVSRLAVERYTDELDNDRKMARWVFYQAGGDNQFEMDLQEQSHGTRALMDLGLQAIDVLDRGRIMVVDELDASLHSALSARLIELFQDPETNPKNAQLVFTSHDVALLGTVRGREVLTKDQIWFTEKGMDGSTELYPFSGYDDDDESARGKRYLVGRFGAVPFLDDDLFIEALAKRERDEPGNAPQASSADER